MRDEGSRVDDLNELEYIDGVIYANVWMSDRIARISPETGEVLSWIDLEGLLPASERSGSEDVLNGIAFDPDGRRPVRHGKTLAQAFRNRGGSEVESPASCPREAPVPKTLDPRAGRWAFSLAALSALIWPVYSFFGTIEPFVLGIPFSLFYLVILIGVVFSVMLALFVWEGRNDRLG